MYIICFYNKELGTNTWELVSGDDAMQIRVSNLCDSGLEADEIHVFDMDDEL